MSVVINTNVAATAAAINFTQSNAMLQKSLSRLSSGSRIVNPADDAGGLAVSMKLTAAIRRTQAVQSNVANAVSFLQTQDGALKTAGDILNRMSELSTLFNDVTKSTTDKANYQTEFNQLQQQLTSIKGEAFNGVSLFSATNDLSVGISEDGSRSVLVTKTDLTNTSAAGNFNKVQNYSDGTRTGSSHYSLDGSNSSTKLTLGVINTAIQEIATFRAANGAYSSRLQFASSILTVNAQNLQAANSQISDVDVASESTNFAKYNILVQSGASMLAQANASAQIAIKLIGG